MEVGHEIAKGLHEAAIIDDKEMKELDNLCDEEEIENAFYEASKKFSWDKYKPIYAPKDYLEFMNKYHDCQFWDSWDSKEIHLRNTVYSGKEMLQTDCRGSCIEECLDQAILGTGFYKELEKK